MAQGILIGVGGFAESGKDTFVDELEHAGWERTFMSKHLLRALMTLNPMIGATHVADNPPVVNGIYFRELVEMVGYTKAKKHPEVRRLLIRMGTEVGREQFGESFWMDQILDEVWPTVEAGKNVAITGIRFQNELDTIHGLGGVSVYISRPGIKPAGGGHIGEVGLKPDDFNFHFKNNGTVEQLMWKAHVWQEQMTADPEQRDADLRT